MFNYFINIYNKMIYSIILLLSGIAIGQEYQGIIPPIKVLAINLLTQIQEYLKQNAIEQKATENTFSYLSSIIYNFFVKK